MPSAHTRPGLSLAESPVAGPIENRIHGADRSGTMLNATIVSAVGITITAAMAARPNWITRPPRRQPYADAPIARHTNASAAAIATPPLSAARSGGCAAAYASAPAFLGKSD